METNRVIAILSSALELFTALCGVTLTVYIVFASESRLVLQKTIDFGSSHQPLGLLFFIVMFCWFFVIATTMLFPFAVRADASKKADLRYLYSAAAMGLGPWLDVLIISLSRGFSMINIDRVAVQYLGVGAIAMFLAAISGKTPSPKAAFIISILAMVGFALFYAGLWLVGGMGNIFTILVWHGVMFYSGFAVFQEWLWFMRGE